jgi:hypothetical protein
MSRKIRSKLCKYLGYAPACNRCNPGFEHSETLERFSRIFEDWELLPRCEICRICIFRFCVSMIW